MEMTRRTFLGASAAAVIAAGTTARGKVFGANERIRVGIVGVNGRGGSHIEGFGELKDCEIGAICDVDSKVVSRRVAEIEKTFGYKPKTYRDIRDLLADDSIDAITIATPNHWHSLASIWGCQAGKDVYVEKPLSHNIYEGRQLVAAAEKHGRVVQHGTQSRSSSTWMRDIKLLHDGFIGKVHTAKGYTYKTGNRGPIGFGRPAAAPENLDWSLWQGPAAKREYLERTDGKGGLYVHYNWHWCWDYGNGETGNQCVHQMDLAVWGLNRGYPAKVYSTGGRYGWDDDAETPNTQMTLMTYADGGVLQLEVRNMGSYDEAGKETGNHFLATEGYYVEGKGFFDLKHKPIPVTAEAPESAGPWANFIHAMRTRKPEDIRGNVSEGHLSAAHCHLSNIAYRLGRSLEFDGEKERFINDKDANRMLSRDYQKGFEVPKLA